MEKFSEIFYSYIDKKMKRQLHKVDELCVEFDIDPYDFWEFYLKDVSHLTGVDFLNDVLTNFYYYLTGEIDKLFKNLEIDFEIFYFYTEGSSVDFNDYEGFKEFKEKILNADIETKKTLMENKIFKHYMDKLGVIIFKNKELRLLKLENIL